MEELPRIWLRLLREPGEVWILYHVAEKGELPTIDDDFDGILIPGATATAACARVCAVLGAAAAGCWSLACAPTCPLTPLAGSSHSAYEDLPWIHRLKVRQLHAVPRVVLH